VVGFTADHCPLNCPLSPHGAPCTLFSGRGWTRDESGPPCFGALDPRLLSESLPDPARFHDYHRCALPNSTPLLHAHFRRTQRARFTSKLLSLGYRLAPSYFTLRRSDSLRPLAEGRLSFPQRFQLSDHRATTSITGFIGPFLCLLVSCRE